jgi:hypothetical protein
MKACCVPVIRAPHEPRAQPANFVRRWAVVTVFGASCLTLVDGLLLERSKGYFTGGFLATDHLAGVSDTAAFLATSLISDAAVVGLLAAFVMLVLTRLRVRATAAAVAGLLGGMGPLLAADVISYELAAYVGDFVDLSLSLELGGGSVREVLAVASSHLLAPAAMIFLTTGAAGGAVWMVSR